MHLRPFLHVAIAAAPALLCGCDARERWQEATWRPEPPAQRVVLGSVLAVESLLDLLPRERLAAVHAIVTDPRYSLVAVEAAGLPAVGAAPEQLLSVRPDLVIVDAYTQAETLGLLAAADVPVVRTADPHSFDDIRANLRLLGRITGLDAATERTIDAFDARLDRVRARGGEVADWQLLGLDGALHSYGNGSLFDLLTRAAGANNLAAAHGVGSFRKLDIETVLAWRPDAIVLADDGEGGTGAPEWLLQMPGLSLLPCVAAGRVIRVPGALLSTTSHRLVEAAEHVQRQLLAWGRP